MTTRTWVALFAAGALALAACGGKDKKTADGDATDDVEPADGEDATDPTADPAEDPVPDATPDPTGDPAEDLLEDGEDVTEDGSEDASSDASSEDEWDYPGIDSFDLTTDTNGDTVPDHAPLLITEFMANPRAADDATGEYIEVRNMSGVDIDIEGLYVRDTAPGSVTTISAPTLLLAGGYVLFGKTSTAGENYGVGSGSTPTFLYFQANFNLNNGGDDYVEIGHSGTVIHHVAYNAGGTGSTLVSIPGTPTEGQSFSLDQDYVTGSTTTATWCLTPESTPYDYHTVGSDTDYGTPGLANPTCS